MWKIIKRGTTQDGTHIQIEDWSTSYPVIYPESATIGAYPIAIKSRGYNYPEVGKTFRVEFNFKNADEAQAAFKQLVNGHKQLSDYKNLLWNTRDANCF